MTDTIRGNVVRLIRDVEPGTPRWDDSAATGRLRLYQAHLGARHEDGRPFTEDEALTIASATRAEYDYSRHLADLHQRAVEAQWADSKRFGEIVEPYWAENPDLTLGDVMSRMSADDLAELTAVLARLTSPDRVMRPDAEDTVHYDTYRRALAELG
jgi:hypothetical protein